MVNNKLKEINVNDRSYYNSNYIIRIEDPEFENKERSHIKILSLIILDIRNTWYITLALYYS